MSESAPEVEPDIGPPQPAVRRRTVFYIAGFDPQGPGHYHRLFCEQAAAQSAVTDYELCIGPRTSAGPHVSSWDVTYTGLSGQTVETRYQLLRWDDLVRRHWPRGPVRLALVTVRATLGLLGNGSWLSMCRLSWVAGLTLALPSLVGLVGIFSSVTALSLLWAMSAAATPSAPIQVSYGLGAALALGAALMLPRGWRYGQGGWLMRSTASLLRYARGQAPEIDERISLWSELIANRMASGDDDEVQVVAHSSGCIAAVVALSRAIDRLERTQKTRKAVSLLTLGQCIPVLSHQPEAKSFRAALKHLGQIKSLTWIDVSAPPDACCFALTDPCASPHDSDAHSENVKRLSPRYAEQMDSSRYQALKADKLRCHFQYLMAFPTPKHYDFFQWVCGPQTLQQTTQHLKSINNFKRFSW